MDTERNNRHLKAVPDLPDYTPHHEETGIPRDTENQCGLRIRPARGRSMVGGDEGARLLRPAPLHAGTPRMGIQERLPINEPSASVGKSRIPTHPTGVMYYPPATWRRLNDPCGCPDQGTLHPCGPAGAYEIATPAPADPLKTIRAGLRTRVRTARKEHTHRDN